MKAFKNFKLVAAVTIGLIVLFTIFVPSALEWAANNPLLFATIIAVAIFVIRFIMRKKGYLEDNNEKRKKNKK